MKEIINTESLSIVFDANKHRLYYTGKKLREISTEQEEQVRDMGVAKSGDVIVLTAGTPVGRRGTTNMMKLQVIH